VHFEGEDGVERGPVQEFFVNAINIADKGINFLSGKPVVLLEGDAGYCLPIHNQALCLTGAFKPLGKMIGHSVLHGGPRLHGLSSAATHYQQEDGRRYITYLNPVLISKEALLEDY